MTMTPAHASAALAVSLCGIIGLLGFIGLAYVLTALGIIGPEPTRPDDGSYE